MTFSYFQVADSLRHFTFFHYGHRNFWYSHDRPGKDNGLSTADLVGFYKNIPHQVGLETFREVLIKMETHKVSTDKLVKKPEFVLKNNYQLNYTHFIVK